jgi:hypothetical protein
MMPARKRQPKPSTYPPPAWWQISSKGIRLQNGKPGTPAFAETLGEIERLTAEARAAHEAAVNHDGKEPAHA